VSECAAMNDTDVLLATDVTDDDDVCRVLDATRYPEKDAAALKNDATAARIFYRRCVQAASAVCAAFASASLWQAPIPAATAACCAALAQAAVMSIRAVFFPGKRACCMFRVRLCSNSLISLFGEGHLCDIIILALCLWHPLFP
jgi:hypothetical protein